MVATGVFQHRYKTLWLVFVASPLWQAGTQAGSPAEEIAHSFFAAPVLAAVLAWGYADRTYVRWPRGNLAQPLTNAAGVHIGQ